MAATETCSPSGCEPQCKQVHPIFTTIFTCLICPIFLFFVIGFLWAPVSSLMYLYSAPKPVESMLSVISQPASCQLMMFKPQRIQSGFVYSMSISNVWPPGHAADVMRQDSEGHTPFNNTACDVGQAVRVTSLYSDGTCPLHQDACPEGEQATGLQTCGLMASQGVTSSVVSSEAWHIMGEASHIVGASSDSTKFTQFTSGEVCLPGEPSFYFYVSNGCNEESNAPPVYFEVEITERAYRGSATRGKRCQEGVVVSPWPAIARIWLWWLGVPVLCFCGMTAAMVACLCMAPRMGIKITSATVAPTSQQKAGEDSSAPDVEMGALKAEEDDSENDPEKPPDKPATAVS